MQAKTVKIYHRAGYLIGEYPGEDIREALQNAVKAGASLDGARLDGASLDGASLDGARLDGASLDGASLVRASLVRASLDGASLDGASLVRARLDGARLDGARLDGARLDGASLDGARLVRASLVRARLDGARLDGARLDGARLPWGESWENYLTQVLPALLTAGGKTVRQILDSGCWDCHQWDNCPMAFAFDVHSIAEIPHLYRPRAEEFVMLFDSKLIPVSAVEALIPAEATATDEAAAEPRKGA